jgi:hypothetical protein
LCIVEDPVSKTDKIKAFKLGDRVRWQSQAAGSWKEKRGTIVEVVPAKRQPSNAPYSGSRSHEWYVVDVDGQLYYPRVSALIKTGAHP